MISLFSFTDAVHDHTTIGVRRGCVACAQTEADMLLSAKAFRENKPSPSLPVRPVVPPRTSRPSYRASEDGCEPVVRRAALI